MDMYQKREMRKNKKMNEDTKSLPSTSINWYPGHMAKTKRLITESYDLIDMVYEVIDARIPKSSKIKDSDNLIKNKPRLIIMTKSDLCDLTETKKWVKYYEEQGNYCLLVNLNNKDDIKKIESKTYEIMQDMINARLNKGLIKAEIKVLVMGIPNVGKSTLINALAKRHVASTGNMPGVTKNLNWLKTDSDILLLDSPGILWPKFDNETIALNLACTTAIKTDVLPLDEVAIHILNMLNNYYPSILKENYGIDRLSDDLGEDYDIIGRKLNFIMRGNEVDYDRISMKIYNDIKLEKIKGITFDRYE